MDWSVPDGSGRAWGRRLLWFVIRCLPDRLVWACLVRALAEWEPENEWIKDRNVLAAWALVDYWGRRIEGEVGYEHSDGLPGM